MYKGAAWDSPSNYQTYSSLAGTALIRILVRIATKMVNFPSKKLTLQRSTLLYFSKKTRAEAVLRDYHEVKVCVCVCAVCVQ